MRSDSWTALRRAGICALLAALAQGCATQENIRAAIQEVNQEFKQQYEQILEETPFGFSKAAQLTDPSKLAASCRPRNWFAPPPLTASTLPA